MTEGNLIKQWLFPILVLPCLPLQAGDRVALVIGNADYQVGPLRNSVNDANDVATSLQAIGFEVVLGTNLSRDDMDRKLLEFGRKLQPGGIAVMYYSGHGVQLDGQNWLLPVSNSIIQTRSDVQIHSVSVQGVLQMMDRGNTKLNVLILEACRDLRLAAELKGADRGWARIDPPGGPTLVALATKPGETVSEGDGRNSLFTSVLKVALRIPGLPVIDMFTQVSTQVYRDSGGAQVPQMSIGSTVPPISLAGNTAATVSPGLTPGPSLDHSVPVKEPDPEPSSATRWIATLGALLLACLLALSLRRRSR